MKIIGLDASMNGSGVVSLNLDQNVNVMDRDYLCFTTAAYIAEKSNDKIKHWKSDMFRNSFAESQCVEHFFPDNNPVSANKNAPMQSEATSAPLLY